MCEDKKLNLKVGGKYVTRNGRIVKVVSDPGERYSYYRYRVRLTDNGGEYDVTEHGTYWLSKLPSDYDLVSEYVESAPELSERGTHTLYLNVYRDGVKVHKFLEDAEAYAGPDRIRCEVIQVKY